MNTATKIKLVLAAICLSSLMVGLEISSIPAPPLSETITAGNLQVAETA